jgi:SAM-dependent methyltransferase
VTDELATQWDAAYAGDSPPPWMIETPQPEVVMLLDRGLVSGRMLDSGCGTGEHSLAAADAGAVVTGVDISGRAVGQAKRKADARGAAAQFAVVNMLHPAPFRERSFDTLLDSGVFHSFAGADQRTYVDNLTRLARDGALLHLICFSEHQPGEGEWGPRRITQAEIRSAFADGWAVDELEPATFRINEFHDTTQVLAWRALLRRR